MPKKGLIVFYRSRRSLKGYIVTSYRICFFFVWASLRCKCGVQGHGFRVSSSSGVG